MKVRVTSIAWREVSEMVRSLTVDLQNSLTPIFEGLTFGAGISQLTIVIVCASSEEAENRRLSKAYNKIGRLRNPMTDEPIKYIGLAVPVAFDALVGLDQLSLRKVICPLLLEKIAKPDIRIPKEFEYEAFSQFLSGTVANFCPMMVS